MDRYTISKDTLYQLEYLIVWCPKNRKPVLLGDIAVRLEALIRVKSAILGTTILSLKIEPDMVSLKLCSDPSKAPAHLAAQFKGFTSKLREEFPNLKSVLPTLWSRSYFICSVGSVSINQIDQYYKQQGTRKSQLKYGHTS